jgi:hypothetical protein
MYPVWSQRLMVCLPTLLTWQNQQLYPDIDAWYLGSTPVRFIKLVGMVVGVDQWDNENNYRTSHFSKTS